VWAKVNSIYTFLKNVSNINWICTVLQNVSKYRLNIHSVTKCSQIAIQYAQCYKMLAKVNSICTFLKKCWLISIENAQCYKMLVSINWICTVLQNISKYHLNRHSVTKCLQMSIQYAQCYKMLTNVNSICTVLQNVSKCQLHMHIFGVTNFEHDVKKLGLCLLFLTRCFTASKYSILSLWSMFLFMSMDVIFTSV
jgi:hypothetical protein